MTDTFRPPARQTTGPAALLIHSVWFRLFLDGAVLLFFLIHLQVFVSLPIKLNGGPLPGLGFVWAVGSMIGLVLAVTRPLRTAAIGILIFPFVALCMWAYLSSSWSADPVDTLRASTFMTCSLIGACAIAAHLTWEEILARLTLALGSLMVLSVGLAIAVPSIGQMTDILQGAWSGVWGEKQAMGMYAALLILASLSLALSNQKYWPCLFLVPLSLVAIIGTTGKTAILMSFMGIAVFVTGWLVQRDLRVAIATLWTSILLGSATLYGLTQGKEAVFRLLGRKPDFTGRTEVWREVEYVARKKPTTGYGFHAVWEDQTSIDGPYQWIADGTGFFPQNAHSSWWDVVLQLGTPGAVLLTICMALAWIAVLVRIRHGGPGALFAVSALATLTLISFTESILVSSMDMPWMLVMLIAAKSLQEFFFPARLASPTSYPQRGYVGRRPSR
ncbi:O-antigen ligase [Aquidulcibacter sp.]|uniref:O-antigen ligase family protein n=1 Tax=Aquidulcibacter sp. TaxID=2052990 RepID=UPI0025C68422|nr:O-antigen ligase family protein [Aquidulcibacter sp.]MCA3694138.1 O-antigen ligase family protein [Aquidulcibacter sp.]